MRPLFSIPQLSGKGQLHARHSAKQWRGPTEEDITALSLTSYKFNRRHELVTPVTYYKAEWGKTEMASGWEGI